MSDLYITCPVTGRDFYSGMTMDLGSITVTDCRTSCPHCGGAHTFNTEDLHEKKAPWWRRLRGER